MRACTKCAESKPLSEFCKRPDVKSGFASHCKTCQREWRTANRNALLAQKKQYYDSNRDQIAQRKRQRYEANRDELLERQRQRYAVDPERFRWHEMRRRYGISKAKYDALFTAQGGLCAICRAACTTGRSLAVDHDHKTGRVRGLLCANCNFGLGKFRDSSALLSAAINYLDSQRDPGDLLPNKSFLSGGNPST